MSQNIHLLFSEQNCQKLTEPILMIFVLWNPQKIWHENLTDCPSRLSDVATVPWEIQKSHFFNSIYSYILLIVYVISQENNL